MNHNSWHRATIPQGVQNMLNKLVPLSCNDTNAHMNYCPCMHRPTEHNRIISLHWQGCF